MSARCAECDELVASDPYPDESQAGGSCACCDGPMCEDCAIKTGSLCTECKVVIES